MDKLQRAGRDFLMRLVAKHGLQGAARVLRALANELETLAGLRCKRARQSQTIGSNRTKSASVAFGD